MTTAAPRRIWLASKSPRRQDLLRQIGVDFDVLAPRDANGREIMEAPRRGEAAHDYVRRIARTKAAVGWHHAEVRGLETRPVLAADTEVIADGDVLGKPRDAAHAAVMLARLSGSAHEVVTAVALRWNGAMQLALCRSTVTLRALSAGEIAAYVASGEPFDKAGGYAIQGRAAAFVSHLSGSHSGVMGLPLYETASLLAAIGYHSPEAAACSQTR